MNKILLSLSIFLVLIITQTNAIWRSELELMGLSDEEQTKPFIEECNKKAPHLTNLKNKVSKQLNLKALMATSLRSDQDGRNSMAVLSNIFQPELLNDKTAQAIEHDVDNLIPLISAREDNCLAFLTRNRFLDEDRVGDKPVSNRKSCKEAIYATSLLGLAYLAAERHPEIRSKISKISKQVEQLDLNDKEQMELNKLYFETISTYYISLNTRQYRHSNQPQIRTS